MACRSFPSWPVIFHSDFRQGMERNYNDLGAPGIFRNDRLWIAGDHVVDPRVNHLPQIKKLIDSSERAKRVFKLVDYQGMNVRCDSTPVNNLTC